MAAGFALFLLDAIAIAAVWPLIVAFLLSGGPIGYLQGMGFAVLQLGSLYALGLYRREGVAELDQSLRRLPLVTALSVAASSFASALLGFDVSTALCASALVCFFDLCRRRPRAVCRLEASFAVQDAFVDHWRRQARLGLAADVEGAGTQSAIRLDLCT